MSNQITVKPPSRFSRFLERRYGSELFSSSQIFRMLVPLIIDQFFIYLIGMLTNAMISTSSQASVTAVGMVFPVNMVMTNLFSAIGSGGTILVAQYHGKGDTEKTRKAAAQVISLSFIAAAVLSIVAIIFAPAIVDLLFPKAELIIREKAALYIRGMCLSNLPFSIYNSIFCALRGVGDTTRCLRLTIVINAIHLIASFLFINIFKWDIIGTTMSYTLARTIGAIVAVLLITTASSTIKLKIRDFIEFNGAVIKTIVRLGIPFAVEQIFINAGAIVAQMFISTLGTTSMAANTIASSCSNLFYGAGFAISALTVTVVGQSMGYGDPALARKYSKRMFELGVIISLISIAVIYPLMPLILKLYNPLPETLPIIYQLIFIGVIPLPFFWSSAFIFPSSLRAAGDTGFTSIVCLISMWLCRVLLGYLFTITLGFGVHGVWLSLGVEWALRSAIFAIRLHGKKWLTKKVI